MVQNHEILGKKNEWLRKLQPMNFEPFFRSHSTIVHDSIIFRIMFVGTIFHVSFADSLLCGRAEQDIESILEATTG